MSPAHSFCGTFVGSPGSHLVNRTSQIVVARQGSRTTLTLAADFEGDLSDFALLIPVPESLDRSGVHTLDPAIVDRLDRYSTPRLVSYACRDAVHVQHSGMSCGPYYLGGCAAASDDALSTYAETVAGDVELESAEGAVTVEAEFRVAEYDVVLLSADGAGGLYDWLDANGFAIPPGGEGILQDYIDAGVHFLAAKVHLDALEAGTVSRLSPLQLAYDADDWVLPIRIGTISAAEEQEVLIYALTDSRDGDVAIANFPEVAVEDECMFDEDRYGTFGEFYRDRMHDAQPDSGLGWVTEYSWTLYRLSQDTGYHCDPCTVSKEELYDPGELGELGFDDPGTTGTTWSTWGYSGGTTTGYDPGGAQLTRLRLVYDPANAIEDLALYTTGMHRENRQVRYIQYDRRLEFLFPVCGEGFVDEPGSCGDELDPAADHGRAQVPAALIQAGLLAAGTLAIGLRRRGR